jgi:hypothetical protein
MTNEPEPTTQVSMIASVVYEEWPDGSRTARLSFWEEKPMAYYVNGEPRCPRGASDDDPAAVAARERALAAFPEQEQPLPTLVMREVRA